MKYVFAGSYQQYVEWSRDRMGDHEYIDGPNCLYGKQINPDDVVYFGSWRSRVDYQDVADALRWSTMKQETVWDKLKGKMATTLVVPTGLVTT